MTVEKIMSELIKQYANQNHIKVEYTIEIKTDDKKNENEE